MTSHSSGKIPQALAKIDSRFEYVADRDAALEAWGGHVEPLIRPTPSNGVELARRTEA
jgi:hypothetical protein